MTLRQPLSINIPYCATCQALQRTDAVRCWLCGATLTAAPVEPHPAVVAPAAKMVAPAVASVAAEPMGGYSLASLMMFVTLFSVVLGVSTIAPGVGIPLGIVLLVAWLRTAAVARLRRERGLAVSRPERVQLFLASFGVTISLIALVCVAGCATYFAACFACIFTDEGLQGTVSQDAAAFFGQFVYGAVVFVIAVPVLWWVQKIIRRRWRRDIGDAD